MKVYSRKVRDYVPTAKKIKVHKGSFRGQLSIGSKRRFPCGHQNCWVSCSIGKI